MKTNFISLILWWARTSEVLVQAVFTWGLSCRILVSLRYMLSSEIAGIIHIWTNCNHRKVCIAWILGLDVQDDLLTWLAGFVGNWLEAWLRLPTGVCTRGLNFLTWWLLQGSWTSYIVIQEYQNMCPSAQEKPHCPLWCSLRSNAASHFQHCRWYLWVRSLHGCTRGEYRSRFWWRGFPSGSDDEESARDPGSIPASGGSPGERNGHPLQYSFLENFMVRGAWQVCRVTMSWTGVPKICGHKTAR